MGDGRKHVLFVDGEPAIQRNVARIVSVGAPELRLSCASNGAEALRTLERDRVDLLITSLMMPVIDGVELLRHLANRRTIVPVLVLTEEGSPAVETRSQAGRRVDFIREPIEREPLLRAVRDKLGAGPAQGGVTLVDLLYLLKTARRSAAVRVSAGAEQGALFVSAGALIDARHGSTVGMSAALEVLRWHDPVVTLDILVRARTPTIFASLEELLTAARQVDDIAEEEALTTRRSLALGAPPAVETLAVVAPAPPVASVTPPRRPHLSLVPAAVEEEAAEQDVVEEAAEEETPANAVPGPAPAHAQAPWERPAVQAKIAATIAAALKIEGAVAAALASWEVDHSVGTIGGAQTRPLESMISGHCRIMRAMAAMMARLGMTGSFRDISLTNENGHLDVLMPLRGEDGLFLWLEIDQRRGNLVLAHRRAQKLIDELSEAIHER